MVPAAKTLFGEAIRGYVRNAGPLLSGAIAFYAMLRAAPIMVITVAMAGAFFGEEAARKELVTQLQGPLGAPGAQLVNTALKDAGSLGGGFVATLIGAGVAFWAASRLFAQLHLALNHTFGVREKEKATITKATGSMLRKRLLSVGMVLLCGALLVSLLVAKTVLLGVVALIDDVIRIPWAFRLVEALASTGALAVLIGVMYKLLPDVRLAWRDVSIGSLTTALLLSIGSEVIGAYLGTFSLASSFGAAGSFVLVLLWAYYSSQIFFFGAEFSQVWAARRGNPLSRTMADDS